VTATLVIRVGSVEEARRELREDLVTIARGGRVRRRRELWFPSLSEAAAALTDRRLGLLRLIADRQPRSTAQLARLARRPSRSVTSDLQALARIGLVRLVAGDRPVAVYRRIRLAGDIALARDAA
jgi:predicted transcriptional regulator